MTGVLDPAARDFLAARKNLPDMHTMEPTAVRALMAQAKQPVIELASIARFEDRVFAARDGAPIDIRIYYPDGDGPFPIFVHFHSGGWVIGSLDTPHATLHMVANHCESIVFSVGYRLAPEHKFPVPAYDCYDAVQWVADNARTFNGDPSRISIGGDSAGGNLAMAVSLMSRDRGGPDIASQVILYGIADVGFDTPSYQEFARGYILTRDWMMWFVDHYVSSELDRSSPYVAPLRSDNLAGLPPTFVITAEFDVLRDEGKALADRLAAAGNDVSYKCETGLIHGFFSNPAEFRDRVEATVADMAVFMNRRQKSNRRESANNAVVG